MRGDIELMGGPQVPPPGKTLSVDHDFPLCHCHSWSFLLSLWFLFQTDFPTYIRPWLPLLKPEGELVELC